MCLHGGTADALVLGTSNFGCESSSLSAGTTDIMFEDISEYIKKPREERRSHLKLDEPCIRIGGHSSTVFKGLLAHYLKTTIPTRQRILLCHACNVGDCSNVNHLYWGTDSDNFQDSPREFKRKTKPIQNGVWLGKNYGGWNKLTDEQLKEIKLIIDNEPRVRGFISKLEKKLNVSHTQVRRYIKMIYPAEV